MDAVIMVLEIHNLQP